MKTPWRHVVATTTSRKCQTTTSPSPFIGVELVDQWSFDFDSLDEGTINGSRRRGIVVNKILAPLMSYCHDDKGFHIGALVDAWHMPQCTSIVDIKSLIPFPLENKGWPTQRFCVILKLSHTVRITHHPIKRKNLSLQIQTSSPSPIHALHWLHIELGALILVEFSLKPNPSLWLGPF